MKLSPLTVPYRAFQKASSLIVAAVFFASSGSVPRDLAIGAASLALFVSFTYESAYYRRFEYRLTEDTFDILSGVFTRRNREIPYRRIQNVDVSRNVVQRILGIAAVDLETAGGSSTEGSIRFVSAAEATRLQQEIQRRKAGRGPEGPTGEGTGEPGEASTGAAAGPTEETLFSIAPTELALVGALSFDARLVGLLVFVGSGSVPFVSGLVPDLSMLFITVTGLLFVGALLIGSWTLGAAVTISNYWGFRLSRIGDELRYERGLLRRFSGSIPTEKIQSLTITDNPAKRLFGYTSLAIETAGYAVEQGSAGGSQSAVPLARNDRVRELARTVEPFGEPRFTRPPSRIRFRYAFQYTLLVGLLTAVAAGIHAYFGLFDRWYALLALVVFTPLGAHYKWKHRGYWLGPDHLVTRVGFWRRETKIVPYYRIQTVIDSRTIFQRRWGVATVVADTAGSGSLVGRDAVAVDVESDTAQLLREELTNQLQRALLDRRGRRRGSATTETADSVREREMTGIDSAETVDVEGVELEPVEDGDVSENESTKEGDRGLTEDDVDDGGTDDVEDEARETTGSTNHDTNDTDETDDTDDGNEEEK